MGAPGLLISVRINEARLFGDLDPRIVGQGRTIGRRTVQAELVSMSTHTCRVRLSNGDIIKRKLRRDLHG